MAPKQMLVLVQVFMGSTVRDSGITWDDFLSVDLCVAVNLKRRYIHRKIFIFFGKPCEFTSKLV